MNNIYEEILEFVDGRINGFEKPEIFYMNDIILSAYFDDNEILVPSLSTNIDSMREWYNSFIITFIQKHYNIKLEEDNMIVFCMLHEIGHIMTMKGFNNDDMYEYTDKLYKNKLTDEEYRLTPIESMADSWALTFIRLYPEILNIK